MGQMDWILLTNWIISGFIGLVFGVIGGWVTYRGNRHRDDIAWQREKQKFQENWQHQKELLEIQFEQRLKELELQLKREENERLRSTLLKGVDNPTETIVTLQRARVSLQLESRSEDDSLKLIEDMRHHAIWEHHNSSDAKGSTWSAIASEAGQFNYDYNFLVYFLKLKNRNNGWRISNAPYESVPIPSIEEFIEILEVRLNHIKRVIDSGDLSLKWEWPSSWGHIPWNGPIIHTNTIQKLSDEAYIYIAQREYAQTKTSIEQYNILLGK